MDVSSVSMSYGYSGLYERAAAAPVPAREDGVARKSAEGAEEARGNRPNALSAAREAANAADRKVASISFENEEGARVMKVHDQEGVLIYQYPPEGVLQLVQQQDSQSASQVKTTA